MADKPIPFSAPMVRALLDGTKTQTRRALSLKGHRTFSEFGPSDTAGYDWHFRDAALRWHDHTHASLYKLPPYAVGDRLYVREAWRADAQWDHVAPRVLGPIDAVQYEADGQRNLSAWGDPFSLGRYRHARFMPRWASRPTLTVTDVRVQRLQEISEADAIAEGCRPFFDHDNPTDYVGPNGTVHQMAPLRGPLVAFHRLWDSINGPGAWGANPWVAAYTFTVQRGNIDQMEAAE